MKTVDRLLRLAVAGLSAATFSACMLLAGGSSSTETGDKVALTGTVVGGNGEGIPGVIVTLAHTSLTDTTDLTGAYRLMGRRPEKVPVQKPDTLNFILNGKVITAAEVREVAEGAVEPVTLVQRGFSGSFTVPDDAIVRIEAVVTGDGIDPEDPLTATFFHNTLAGNYSGFVWFPAPVGQMREYTVRIDTYDEHNRHTGRSVDVPFNELAGNVTIPAFDPNNLVPPAKAAVPGTFGIQPGGSHASP